MNGMRAEPNVYLVSESETAVNPKDRVFRLGKEMSSNTNLFPFFFFACSSRVKLLSFCCRVA